MTALDTRALDVATSWLNDEEKLTGLIRLAVSEYDCSLVEIMLLDPDYVDNEICPVRKGEHTHCLDCVVAVLVAAHRRAVPYKAAVVSPPGDYIQEELVAREWTQRHFAKLLGYTKTDVSRLIEGKRSLTPDDAINLSRVFGTSAEMWLNLQQSYDAHRRKEAHYDPRP